MHTGRFPTALPANAVSLPAPTGPVDAGPTSTRRDWLRSLALVGGSLAAGTWLGPWLGADAAAGPDEPALSPSRPQPTPERATDLDWALSMVERSDDELLHLAGELEMVAARHRDARGLIAVFDRMLDLSLADLGAKPEQLDIAGACAMRSLQRLGAGSLVTGRADEILERRDRPLSLAAFELVERRSRRRRVGTDRAGAGR